jgi:hypothetical protein
MKVLVIVDETSLRFPISDAQGLSLEGSFSRNNMPESKMHSHEDLLGGIKDCREGS